MAEQVKLIASRREDSGSSGARRLRRAGRVPAILYGAEVQPTKLHVDALDLFHALHTSAGGNVVIRLIVDGEEHLTMPREIQQHPVRGDLLHVDFLALERGRKVRVEVPVHLEGTEAIAAPGVASQMLHQVPIRVQPLAVPDHLSLDISQLTIGDTLRVRDLTLPPGAEIDIDLDETIVTVTSASVLEAPVEELPEAVASLPPERAPVGEAAGSGAPLGSERAEPERAGRAGS